MPFFFPFFFHLVCWRITTYNNVGGDARLRPRSEEMVKEVAYDHHCIESQYLESCIGCIPPEVLGTCLISFLVRAQYSGHFFKKISLPRTQEEEIFFYSPLFLISQETVHTEFHFHLSPSPSHTLFLLLVSFFLSISFFGG